MRLKNKRATHKNRWPWILKKKEGKLLSAESGALASGQSGRRKWILTSDQSDRRKWTLTSGQSERRKWILTSGQSERRKWILTSGQSDHNVPNQSVNVGLLQM